MSSQMTAKLVLEAEDRARGILDQFGRTVVELGDKSERSFGRMDLAVGRTTRSIRQLVIPLVSELAPALDTTTARIASVVTSATTLSRGLGALGLAAAGVAGVLLGQYISSLGQAAQKQRELNEAVRTLDFSGVVNQLREVTRAATTFNESVSGRILGGLAEIAQSPVLMQRGFLGIDRLLEGLVSGLRGDAERIKTTVALRDLAPMERERLLLQARLEALAASRALQQTGLQRFQDIGSVAGVQDVFERLGGITEEEMAIRRQLLTVRAQAEAERMRMAGVPEDVIAQTVFAPLGAQLVTLGQQRRAAESALAFQQTMTLRDVRGRLIPPAQPFPHVEGPAGPPGESEREAVEIVRQGRLAEISLILPRPFPHVEGAEGPLGASERQARAIVEAGRETSLDIERQRLQILRERESLTDSERAAIALQVTEAQRLLEIEQARGDVRKEDLANLRAAVQAQEILQRERERIDPMAGLARGFRDAAEEFESSGRAMQDVARRTASTMRSAFSDQFFALVTGDFKKLPDVARESGRAFVRILTDELARLATAPILQGIRQALGVTAAGAALLVPVAGGGGGQAMAANGIPVAAVSPVTGAVTAATPGATAYQVATAPGGAQVLMPVGGGPLGGLQAFQGVRNFLNTPLSSLFSPGTGVPIIPFNPGGVDASFAYSAAEAAALANAGYAPLVATSAANASFAGSAAEAGALAAAGYGPSATGLSAVTVGQALGVVGAGIGFALSLYGAYQSGDVGGGAMSGALSGAMLGTMIYPGIGTVIGLVAGAALGAGAGALGKGKKTTGKQRSAERAATASRILRELADAVNAAAKEGETGASTEAFDSALQGRMVADNRPAGGIIRRIAELNTAGNLAGHPWNWPPNAEYQELILPQWPPRIDATDLNVGRVNSVGEFIMAAGVDNVRQLLDEVLRIRKDVRERATAIRSQILVGVEDTFEDGVTRQTLVPMSRIAELGQGRQLTVLEQTLTGLDEATRERLLRELLQYDLDHDLRIVRYDPATRAVVSQTNFV